MAKKSLEDIDPEVQKQQEAQQKLAEAEALAAAQAGIRFQHLYKYNNINKCTKILQNIYICPIIGIQTPKYLMKKSFFFSAEANLKEQTKNREAQSQVKEILQERLDLYKVEIDENELNLRRNIILGGVFYFDMLQIPPQPKRIANWIICQLETPQVGNNKQFRPFTLF